MRIRTVLVTGMLGAIALGALAAQSIPVIAAGGEETGWREIVKARAPAIVASAPAAMSAPEDLTPLAPPPGPSEIAAVRAAELSAMRAARIAAATDAYYDEIRTAEWPEYPDYRGESPEQRREENEARMASAARMSLTPVSDDSYADAGAADRTGEEQLATVAVASHPADDSGDATVAEASSAIVGDASAP